MADNTHMRGGLILPKIKSETWQRISLMLFVLGVFACLLRLTTEWKRATTHINNPSYDAEERACFWILSAQCTQQTGAFLALCTPGGGFIPIENVSLADDRGYAFLANIAAYCKKSPFGKIDMTRIHLLVNSTGVGILAFFFWRIGLRWTAILWVILAPLYAIPGPIPGPDAPSSYIGVVCWALLPFLWIMTLPARQLEGKAAILEGLIIGGALTAAILLRSPIGLVGWVCFFMAWMWNLGILKLRNKKEARFYAALLIFLVIPFLVTPVLIASRNKILGLKGGQVLSHGVSQTLFHGLGTEPNPWGIRWDDAYGLEFVKRIDPNAHYLTPTYIEILRKHYWQIVRTQPLQVSKIYAIKLYRTVTFPFQIGGFPLWVGEILGIVVLLFLRWKVPKACREPLKVAVGVLLFSGLFLMQGVLGIPWGNHLYPIKLLVVLMICCFSDVLFLWKDYGFSSKPSVSLTR